MGWRSCNSNACPSFDGGNGNPVSTCNKSIKSFRCGKYAKVKLQLTNGYWVQSRFVQKMRDITDADRIWVKGSNPNGHAAKRYSVLKNSKKDLKKAQQWEAAHS